MEDSSPSDGNTTMSQPVHSPDLFSSEDESTCRTGELSPSSTSPLKALIQEKKDAIQELESSRLQRLMMFLQGVPPPPSVTIPQILLTEVLQKWKQNNDQDSAGSSFAQNERIISLWKPTASRDEVLAAGWPEIKNIVYHDVHFNYCNASEDVERLSMKIHERFIGAETSSWCNTVASSLPNSAKKRQRMRSLGNTSPGCRLSHLAKRRQTFSSANLAQLSSVAGSGKAGGVPAVGGKQTGPRRNIVNGGGAGNERRRIMVEIKKTDKNKRIKTNSKEAIDKLAQYRNTVNNVTDAEPSSLSTKRALFQSPEEQKHAASAACSSAAYEAYDVPRPKRTLWPSEKETSASNAGKRSLDNIDISNIQRSKVHCPEERVLFNRSTRSLPLPPGRNSVGNVASKSTSSSLSSNAQSISDLHKSNRRASDQGPSSQNNNACHGLSELHKRKLFWAVTVALRNEGISKVNAQFQRLATILAFHYMDVRKCMKGPPPSSTSEHMLQVVSAKASELVQAESQPVKQGQEENHGGDVSQKRDERPNKELFRDATASLNVRRSLGVSLSSSDHQASDGKQKTTMKVPSARKSLSFDLVDPKAVPSAVSDEAIESKFHMDLKAIDNKWRGNGENVPLTSAKRVSRSLFLSPKDDVKSGKKDASEQTSGPDGQFSSVKVSEDQDHTDSKGEAADCKKPNGLENCDDEKLQVTSEVSSIPSVSAVSTTLEADNEASRTSDATSISEHTNSIDVPTNIISVVSNIPPKEIMQEKTDAENHKSDSRSSESNDFGTVRVLRDTKERAARVTSTPHNRRTRKSLSLSKRSLRSSSTDSADQDQSDKKLCLEVDDPSGKTGKSTLISSSDFLELKITLSPLKMTPFVLSTESSTTSKSAFGSPPFIADSSGTRSHSPFLGFPSKDDVNSFGGARESSSVMGKSAVLGDGSSWLDTTQTSKPDVSSEEGNVSQSEKVKVDLEEKVITPLLEAAVLESSVCIGSGSCHSTDADLSFRGRIESLKPSNNSENVTLDLGMNLNVSANLLNMDENDEKSPVLEKWAERASRSAQKNFISSEESNKTEVLDSTVAPQKAGDNSTEESMLPWEDSHLEAASQSSTIMFDKFRRIFDSSSQEGNS